MKIGIIGASLAGLVAGKKLGRAGHDITIIEKNRTLGGRLATLDDGNGNLFDYGVSHFHARKKDFKTFVNYLEEEKIVQEWSSRFEYFDGEQLHDLNPNRSPELHYSSTNGFSKIADKLSRWVDIKSSVQAGGLTYIGDDRTKKRAWMINLTDISVFECDAVIIATPAIQAYGILLTAQDETPARRILRHVDEFQYDPSFTIMASYEDQGVPEWDAVECLDENLKWIINESTKRNNADTSLVIHSAASFARKNKEQDPEQIANQLLQHAADVTGESWISQPKAKHFHHWKYASCKNPIDEDFMELEMDEAPLAIIGDYLGGNSVESSYLSGLRLAEYWNEKYELAEV
ncbi:FAD-dependent oxidoreductase [Aliifodinibius sp. S!AR15-10]|uniref:NAD(P)/FAD-dependent oxidoreductase n=1 Tax=Aliifodinibius sp. S!AR15-10 TaxID=2950437 RepID=UPI00285B651D|nr:FAD-dependent oxidoreductase [Aliifodinibius sp. S!AR15-10]MDR8394422.1 FAD-dependent oxidoreductase [Aliifodinibius sp. S!AR15-10]